MALDGDQYGTCTLQDAQVQVRTFDDEDQQDQSVEDLRLDAEKGAIQAIGVTAPGLLLVASVSSLTAADAEAIARELGGEVLELSQ